jgi:hypothetical protein
MEQQSRQRCEYDVRPGSGHSDENHVTPRMIERGKIHRHRLGVSEQKWRSQNQQERWQQDRPKRIDVLQWIEGYPPETIGGVVTQAMSNEAVCRFVQSDGEDDREDPRRRRVQHHVELHGTPRLLRTLAAVNSNGPVNPAQ